MVIMMRIEAKEEIIITHTSAILMVTYSPTHCLPGCGKEDSSEEHCVTPIGVKAEISTSAANIIKSSISRPAQKSVGSQS